MKSVRSFSSQASRYSQRIIEFRWLPYIIAAFFTIVFLWLINRQYLTFQLRGADIDRFYQGIWNTLRGHFLYTSITEESLLADHFSPYLALLSPLVQIWPDPRILFMVQLVGITITGLILYEIFPKERRGIAIVFLLAFYLNPALHQVALIELRRVSLAMPFLALMLYGLVKEKYSLMLIGILFVLLIKEDMGLIVAMVGLYLLVFKKEWRWGIPILVLGLVWTFSMLIFVIPEIAGDSYSQLGYFDSWGSSIGEILQNILSNPMMAFRTMFDGASLRSLWRLLLPLAIVLPFLAADIALIILPSLAMMLLSSEPSMHELNRWYLAPILPVLFAAVAIALIRLPLRLSKWAAVALIGSTLLAFLLYSQAPLGGRFEKSRYVFTDRHRQAWAIIEEVPDDATLAAQMAFITPLANRANIYLYPWYERAEGELDYFVMGGGFNAYPIPGNELDWEIRNLVAQPDVIVEKQSEDIYLLHMGGSPNESTVFNAVAEGAIRLDRVELAAADEEGFYQTVLDDRPTLTPGQILRVTLYWEALADMDVDRTVSVRIENSDGALIAQHDMQPGDGSRPTSWWEPGWFFRDVYYLTIDPQAAEGPATLDLVLYDSITQERIPFDDQEVLTLWELNISD